MRILPITASMLLAASQVAAQQEIINIPSVMPIALALHLIEAILIIFICFMALKFFRITRPNNLFMVVYLAGGFFLISPIFYTLFYLPNVFHLNINFVSAYLISRISMIAALISLSGLLYYWNREMKRKPKQDK